jgi:hypothetical protein
MWGMALRVPYEWSSVTRGQVGALSAKALAKVPGSPTGVRRVMLIYDNYRQSFCIAIKFDSYERERERERETPPG